MKTCKFSNGIIVVLLFLTGCAAQMTYVQTPQQLINAGEYFESKHVGDINSLVGCLMKNQNSKIEPEWILKSQQLTSDRDQEVLFYQPKDKYRAAHLGVYARLITNGPDTKIQWWVSKVFIGTESVFKSVKGSC